MISLESIKRQCRLELEDNTENDYLQELLADAIEAVEQRLNRKLYADQAAIDADPAATETALILPRSVRRAVLMLISDLYENRGATSVLTLNANPLFDDMLNPWRVYPNGY